MDDNEIMMQVKEGKKEFYEILVKKYMVQAKAFAYKYVHDWFAAEDIVQDSFVDIYIQRFAFNYKFSFSTYLFAIVKYKSINYLKKNRELPISYIENEENGMLEWEEKIVDSVTPEMAAIHKEELSEIFETIQGLEEEERLIIYLYAVKGWKYKEIAERLGKTSIQIKVKLFRTRKKIKERRK